MWKKKLLIQVCVCLFLISAYWGMNYADSEETRDFKDSAIAAISKHYTLSDIWDEGKKIMVATAKVPVAFAGKLTEIHDETKYGEPLDEIGLGETTAVYAVAGGQVEAIGKNDVYNEYVMIKHESAVSIYGNCSEIYVKESEHVRQGQVIASYFNDGENAFYYSLENE